MNFILYPNCIVTEGHKRATIVDLNMGRYLIIEKELAHLLAQLAKYSLENFKAKNDEETFEQLMRLLKELESDELGFFTEIPKQFPKLNIIWDSPAKITNAVLLIENNYSFLKKIFLQLEELACKDIMIIFKNTTDFLKLSEALETIELSRIKNIEIIISWISGIEEKVLAIAKKYYRATRILVYTSPENKKESNVYYTTLSLQDVIACGHTNKDTFVTNIKFFSEAHHHNTCLNRKVCIDEHGNIKNCPFTERSFANIKDTHIQTIIEKEEFRKYWDITKDKIEVCQDCEFRYSCMDCRIIIKGENNIYGQPAKCTYNPYIAKWEGEDGYITVEQWKEKKVKCAKSNA